jgi:hypothetical protein
MQSTVHRCVCGARLARDNPGDRCSPCLNGAAPAVPACPRCRVTSGSCPRCAPPWTPVTWGMVIRAFRQHPEHGRRPPSQARIASCFGLTQSQLSRIENGPPIVHLDGLIQWARMLAIPAERLWFELPRDAGSRESAPATGAGSSRPPPSRSGTGGPRLLTRPQRSGSRTCSAAVRCADHRGHRGHGGVCQVHRRPGGRQEAACRRLVRPVASKPKRKPIDT